MFKDTIKQTVDHSGDISSHKAEINLIAASGVEGLITQIIKPESDTRPIAYSAAAQAGADRAAGREPDWDALYTSEDATIRSTYEVSFVTNWINNPGPGDRHAVAQIKLVFDKTTVQKLMNLLAAMLVEDAQQQRTVSICTNYDGELVREYNDVPPTTTELVTSWTVRQPRFVDLASPDENRAAHEQDDQDDEYDDRCSQCGWSACECEDKHP